MDNEIMIKLDAIKESVNRIEKAVEKQNGRVRVLENWRSWLMGGICLIGLILTWIVPTLAIVAFGD